MPAEWGTITAEEIIAPIGGSLISGKPKTVFSGFSSDSRTVASGDLFWALKGENFDGHDFALKAVDCGARAVVVQKDYPMQLSHLSDAVIITVDNTLKALGDFASWWRHQHNVRIVAVTGSTGKTTTKEMIASILKIGSITLATQGNFNNLIGLPITLLQLKRSHQKAVLEMGMNHPGEIARLTEIADPDVGVITNVGMAHLEGLGNIQNVARAKLELVEKASPRSIILLNGDDGLLMETAAAFRKNVFTFGFGNKNDLHASEIRSLGQEGSSFRLNYQGNSWDVRLNVPGLQNVSNALAAAIVSFHLDIPPQNIIEGLHRFSGVKGRFNLVHLPGGITLVDDTYNSNPTSLKAALNSIEALVNGSGGVIVGLGEMMELGDESTASHQEAGRLVAEIGAKSFMAIGEHAPEMVRGAIESGMNSKKAKVVTSHNEMVKIISDEMRKGDLIFIKGSRKMNLGKIVDDLKDKFH